MKHLIKTSLLAMYLVAALPVVSLAATVGSTTTEKPASMTFVPSSGNVNMNSASEFTVDIQVNIGTGAQSAGADAVVEFDTTKLEYISAEKVTANNPATFYGGMFSSTSAATANSNGVVEIGRAADGGVYATGTGIMATLKFKAKVAAGQTVNLDFDFTSGSSTDSNVASNVGGVDLLGQVTNASLTLAQGAATVPTITSVSPTHGDKGLSQDITIAGTNFGTQGADSKVYLGTKLMTVVSWSDTSIVFTAPAESDLTQSSTRQVKVHRSDGQEATFTGYTYDVAGGELPNNGPEMVTYFGLAMSAFGMAGATYLKLFGSKPKAEVAEATEPTLAE